MKHASGTTEITEQPKRVVVLGTGELDDVLDQAGGDYAFYTSYGDPKATGETTALAGNQWTGLPAVEDDRAFRDDVWCLGLDPIGAGQIVDDLDGYLTD